MSDFAPIFAATEARYGLPPGILAATAQVESRLNPHAVSPKGAIGLMQIMPDTAKGLGVNPLDPAQAIDGAGRVWQQNLKAYGGDIDKAAMAYNGGADPRHWNNPETQAYPAKLAAALGPAHQPTSPHDPFDPIEVALSGHQPSQAAPGSSPADTSDPIEMALAHGNTGSNVDPFDPNVPGGGGTPQGGNRGSGAPDASAGRNMGASPSSIPAGDGGSQARGPNAGLQPHPIGVVPGIIDAFETGATADLVHPLTAALNTVLPLDKLSGEDVHSLWDGSSLGDAFHHNLGIERGNIDQFRQEHFKTALAADMAGAAVSPMNKVFAPAEGASFLRSVPNFMAQGALYGGLRGGSETGSFKGAGEGAALGAALGPVGATIGNVAGKAVGAALKARSTLANAIPQTVKRQVAGMIDQGASVDDIVAAVPEASGIAHIPEWVSYRANGGKAPVSFGAPPPVHDAAVPAPAGPETDNEPIVVTGSRNKQLAAALGSQGSRRGVEAVNDMPPQVQADVQRLTRAGVDPAEAQREADILYVGGKPTVAAVTRDPNEQWAFNEGAKDASTSGGQAMHSTQAANNQALHDATIQTVESYGGVPAQGAPAQTAAQALADASDAAKAKVAKLYADARASDGDVKVNTDQVRELLQSPEFATPTNPQVRQLSDGLRSFLASTDLRNNSTLRSPEQIEDIRQLANSAYDRMGGKVNSAIGKVGAALDNGLDALDSSTPAFKAARAAHRDWAQQYQDPAGVADLIRRDAEGNFVNADQWRANENRLLGGLYDKRFAQVVGQLKSVGANDALNSLKAGVVQNAYETATNGPRDSLGNPIFNGRQFQNALNKVGVPRLQALFSPDEIAHLATIGRAARTLNEPVPGTVNSSNTSAAVTRSSLAKALQAKPGTHPMMNIAKGGLALTGHVPAAVGVHAMEHLSSRSAASAVEQGTREQLNTGLARAMASRSGRRIENAQYRQMVGRMLRNRAPAVSGSAEDNRRAAAGR